MNWRTEVIDPRRMSMDEIGAELRHDLDVYDQVAHPLSREAMARRIDALVAEIDRRNEQAASEDSRRRE